jgi:Fe2+ transport system protein B
MSEKAIEELRQKHDELNVKVAESIMASKLKWNQQGEANKTIFDTLGEVRNSQIALEKSSLVQATQHDQISEQLKDLAKDMEELNKSMETKEKEIRDKIKEEHKEQKEKEESKWDFWKQVLIQCSGAILGAVISFIVWFIWSASASGWFSK